MSNPNNYPTIDQVRKLPLLDNEVVADKWEDENNHVNVTYYMDLYNRAGWPIFTMLGIDQSYFTEHQMGIVDLENHIRYFRELHIGNKVSVYCRFLASDQKKFHGMVIVVNDETDQVACTIEFLTLSVDLTKRKSTPWPESVVNHLEKEVQSSDKLSWQYPTTMSLDLKN